MYKITTLKQKLFKRRSEFREKVICNLISLFNNTYLPIYIIQITNINYK